MATQDGRRVNRPYRKASEYLATSKQPAYNGPRNPVALESENAELREKLTTAVRRMESMEVEFEQSKEYFSTQLDITTDKLNRTAQTLKLLQRSYSELQSINYDLEQRILKVSQLENEKSQLTSDVHELTNKLTDTRAQLNKMQKENERLRKDCNLAVQLLQCNEGNFKKQKANELPRELQHRVEEYRVDISQYNEYINPYSMDSDDESSQDKDSVPPELLAKVLQQPEPGPQSSDYAQNHEMGGTYRGQIVEKKLVKYDYDSPDSLSSQNYSHSSDYNKNEKRSSTIPQSSSGGQSSPWELAPAATSSTSSGQSSGSPWELASTPNQSTGNDDNDDYSSASAYGAFPVSYRRPRPPKAPTRYEFAPGENPEMVPKEKASYSKTRMSATYNRVTSPKKQQKGTGQNEDVYISQTYKQHYDDTDTQVGTSDHSNKSSRKSTPAKVPVDKESGSGAEKSSLLDLQHSDEDEMILTVEMGVKDPTMTSGDSPLKSYGVEMGVESRGLLHGEDSDQEERELDLREKGGLREYGEEDDVEEYGEESDAREYEEEGDMREYEGGSVRESIMREVNLLNLDDNVTVNVSSQSSPAHQIMMQQLLHESPVTEVSSTPLLPDLPPPSRFSEPIYDGELILDPDILVPPPPAMYVEPPMTHPQNSNQLEFSAELITEESVVTSPAQTTPPKMNVPADSTSVPLNELKDENIATHDTEVEESQISSVPPSKIDNVGEEIQELTAVDNDASLELEAPSHEGNTEQVPNNEIEEVSNIGENIAVNSVGNPEDSFISPDITEQNVETQEDKEEIGNSDDLETCGNTENFENESIGVSKDVDEDETQISESAMGNTENLQQENNGNTESSEVNCEQCEIEPLEVLDLQEEPRGGSYNRRRRNSFDKAREYGSVMDD